jgi:hypothetical protein
VRARLLHPGFGEERMLGHGVVLAEFELGGELTGVLGLDVEDSRAGSGNKAHQDGIRPSPSPWRPPQQRESLELPRPSTHFGTVTRLQAPVAYCRGVHIAQSIGGP